MEPSDRVLPKGLNEASSSLDTPWVLGRGIFWLEHLAVRRRVGQMVSGNPKKDSLQFLMAYLKTNGRKLPLGRVLTLGCGKGNIERGLAKFSVAEIHDGMDISEAAITRARELAAEAKLGHINYSVVNINEVKLNPHSYDLVIGQHSFHHFADLEHVCSEVSTALKDEGILYLNEFIGPTRFQWSERQLEVVNAILAVLPQKYRLTEKHLKGFITRPTIENMIELDPSEAVRSAEIVSVVQSHFDIVERKDYGGTILHLLLSGIAKNFTSINNLDQEFLDIVFRLEDALIACGDLTSDFAVIIAKKKGTTTI